MAETTPELVSPYIPVTVDDGLENPTDIAALLQRQENQIAALTDNLNSISQLDTITTRLDAIAKDVAATKTAATSAQTNAANANTNATAAKNAVATLQSKVQTMNNTNLKIVGRYTYYRNELESNGWNPAYPPRFSAI